jgi:hypothetical protein
MIVPCHTDAPDLERFLRGEGRFPHKDGIPARLILALWSAFDEIAEPLLDEAQTRAIKYCQSGQTDDTWRKLERAALQLGRCLATWERYDINYGFITGPYVCRALDELCAASINLWREHEEALRGNHPVDPGLSSGVIHLRNAALGLVS